MNEIIGQRIRERRLALNMSQTDFAIAMGLSNTQKSRVSDWEMGKRKVPTEDVERMAPILETTPTYLLGFSDKVVDSGDLSPEEGDIISRFRNLDSHGRQLIEAVLALEYERCKKA